MDLNVAVIVRFIDRLTSPARRARAGLLGITQETKNITKASAQATKALGLTTAATTAQGKSATGAAKAASGAAAAMNALGVSSTAAAEAARIYAGGQDQASRSTETSGRSAETGARKFTMLERAQLRAAAATRMLARRGEELDRQLTRLAKVSLVTDGMERAGHALGRPLERSVETAASFSQGMTGFGITAELSDAQMAPIRAAILAASSQFALSPEDVLETFAFTRRSGVFLKPAEIIAAGQQAAKFQKLAEVMGSPVTGEEVAGGASSAVREYGFAATPEGVRRYFAMIDAAEKQGGGMKMSDLLQYSRSAGGIMKSFGAGNAAGLADVLAAQQVSMYLAHTGAQAGINFQDLMTNIAHKMTVRRFAKEGVNLPAFIRAAQLKGMSPVEAFAALTDRMTSRYQGTDKMFALAHLMNNQQAGQSLMALIQNLDKFRAYRNAIAKPGAVGTYEGDVKRAVSNPAAVLKRLQVAGQSLAISTGSILLPAVEKFAAVLSRIAGFVSRIQNHGSIFAKIGVFAVAGAAGLALLAGGIGQLFVGIVGPLLIARQLMKMLPLVGVIAKARGLGVAAGAGRVLGLGRLAAPIMLGGLSVPGLNLVLGIVLAVAAAALMLRAHWAGVTSFFQGFGRGFAKAFGPLRPIIIPFSRTVSQVGAAVRRFFGPHPGEDWSKWGESAGSAVGKVAGFIADLIAKITSFVQGIGKFWGSLGGNAAAAAGAGAVAAASAAAAAPHTLPPTHAPPAAAPKAAAGVHIGKVEQHFHIPNVDPKAVVDQASKAGGAGVRRALHDVADG